MSSLCLFFYRRVENKATEDKENQWMGVTVKSQGPGGQVVVRFFFCI